MPKGSSTIFNGSVSSGNVELTVCTYKQLSSAAVLFSLPFDVDPFTLCEFEGTMGCNYGKPECSAFAFSVAKAVEAKLCIDMRSRDQLAVSSVKYGYDGKMFNIVVICGGKKKSQIKAIIKKGIKAMNISYGNVVANMKKLCDCDGKQLKCSSENAAYAAGLWGDAMKSMQVAVTGGVRFSDKSLVADLASEANDKAKEVISVLAKEKGSKCADQGGKMECSKEFKCEVALGAMDYGAFLAFDYFNNVNNELLIRGAKAYTRKQITGDSADQINKHAELTAKKIEKHSFETVAHNMAINGNFSAKAVKGVCGHNIGKQDIAQSIKGAKITCM